MSIVCRAPMRLDFTGGPTDVLPFSLLEGGAVVNCTISFFAETLVQLREDGKFWLKAIDLDIEISDSSDLQIDGKLDLIKYAILKEFPEGGIDVCTKCDAPSGCGLGSSAALTVSLIGAMQRLKAIEFDAESVAEAARRLETEYFGIHEGGQDQYAAAVGGIHLMIFNGYDILLKRLELPQETLQTLEQRLVLCYTGQSRISGEITKHIMKSYMEGDQKTIMSLRKLRDLSFILEDILVNGTLDDLGEFFLESWYYQKSLHPLVSPEKLNYILEQTLLSGATGGKIVGAGGGGCLLFYCDPNGLGKVKKRLRKLGLKLMPFKIVSQGLSF